MFDFLTPCKCVIIKLFCHILLCIRLFCRSEEQPKKLMNHHWWSLLSNFLFWDFLKPIQPEGDFYRPRRKMVYSYESYDFRGYPGGIPGLVSLENPTQQSVLLHPVWPATISSTNSSGILSQYSAGQLIVQFFWFPLDSLTSFVLQFLRISLDSSSCNN